MWVCMYVHSTCNSMTKSVLPVKWSKIGKWFWARKKQVFFPLKKKKSLWIFLWLYNVGQNASNIISLNEQKLLQIYCSLHPPWAQSSHHCCLETMKLPNSHLKCMNLYVILKRSKNGFLDLNFFNFILILIWLVSFLHGLFCYEWFLLDLLTKLLMKKVMVAILKQNVISLPLWKNNTVIKYCLYFCYTFAIVK